jgi:hypothetical protein
MLDSTGPWTLDKLRRLDEAQFQILWFATFRGPPAALLDRPEMERVFLEYQRSSPPAVAALTRQYR